MFSVDVNNLTKRFGSRAVLTNISFSHHKGVLGIAGPNGSGKSTLLKCLAGLVKPTSGTIEWNKDKRLLEKKQLKSHLGYVAPYINLYHELTILENIKLILQLRGQSDSDGKPEDIIERLQLSGTKTQPFGDLSTGQQQRARLASTLIYEPHVLFLDEPGANLDEKGKIIIHRIIDECRNQHKLILLATNNPEELKLADEVVEMSD